MIDKQDSLVELKADIVGAINMAEALDPPTPLVVYMLRMALEEIEREVQEASDGASHKGKL